MGSRRELRLSLNAQFSSLKHLRRTCSTLSSNLTSDLPPLSDLSLTFHLSFYDSLSIHLPVFHPWEYESFPQSRISLSSSQTSRTSAVSVSDLHSCVEQLRHKLNLSQHPDSLSSSSLPQPRCLFHLLSPPLKGDHLLFTGRG